MKKGKKPKAELDKVFHGEKRHPIEHIFEMQHAFRQEVGHLKHDFEEDILCIGDFFKATKEKATENGLPHDYFTGVGPSFANAYCRLFISNPELFPDQKEHPCDLEAWTTYQSLTNPDFDPTVNQGLLELVNLRTALELYEYKGKNLNSIIKHAQDSGQYDLLEEAINHMVIQYYQSTKKQKGA